MSTDIENEDVLYDYFIAALNHFMNLDGWGGQSSLAATCGLCDSTISQIINGSRKASFKSQVKISKGYNLPHSDFIKFGKTILHPSKDISDDNQERSPPNKLILLDFNKKIEIKNDPRHDNMILNLQYIIQNGDPETISAIEMNLMTFKKRIESDIFLKKEREARLKLEEEMVELKKRLSKKIG